MRSRFWLALAFGLCNVAPFAQSAELVYQPVNPNFGGSPFNGPALLANAQAQNPFKDPDRRRNDDPQAQFVRALQSRLLSALADQVTEALFGDDPQDSGTVVFGDQTINFNRGLEAITVEIVDGGSGTSTVIEVPTLQIN